MRLSIIALIVFVAAVVTTRPSECSQLLQSTDFTYLGAFKVPNGSSVGGTEFHWFNYGGEVIAYNPANNSLYLTGHTDDQKVAEISIPTPVNSATLSALPTASVIQQLADITEGNMANLRSDGSEQSGVSGVKLGGLLPYNDQLIGSVYTFYDNITLEATKTVRSHFTSGTTLATTGDFTGMSALGPQTSVVPQAGHVSGFMTTVPSSWQSALGGPVLTGQGGLSVLDRTSAGPAAFAFDPSALSPSTSTTSTALIDYPTGHLTLGTYNSSGTYYHMGSRFWSAWFPDGTDSVVFTGRQGLGTSCYGTGTNVLEENGRTSASTPNTCMGAALETSNVCCYDPSILDHGAHSYPYAMYAWAYDAHDLARVKTGGRIVDDPSPNLVDGVSSSSTDTYKPWHIKPYAGWSLDTASIATMTKGGASAFDPIHNRLYVVQMFADSNRPVIHVYAVNVGSSSPVSGLCGNSNGGSFASAPITGLCSAGTASAVTGTGPWSWTCAGSGGGSTASCGATLLEVPSGDASAAVACSAIAGFR